jgi:hypothetical protein
LKHTIEGVRLSSTRAQRREPASRCSRAAIGFCRAQSKQEKGVKAESSEAKPHFRKRFILSRSMIP